MPSTDFHSPSIITQDPNGGSITWNDISNVKFNDDQYAYSALDKDNFTHSLFLAGYNFTTDDIPANSNIDGVMARAWRKTGGETAIYDNYIYLWTGVGWEGFNLASGNVWLDYKTSYDYGGEFNLWGISNLSEEDVRASTFGVQFAAVNDGDASGTAYVDAILLKVYHSVKEAAAAGPCVDLSNRLSVP